VGKGKRADVYLAVVLFFLCFFWADPMVCRSAKEKRTIKGYGYAANVYLEVRKRRGHIFFE
jgi:hypothetical protein